MTVLCCHLYRCIPATAASAGNTQAKRFQLHTSRCKTALGADAQGRISMGRHSRRGKDNKVWRAPPSPPVPLSKAVLSVGGGGSWQLRATA